MTDDGLKYLGEAWKDLQTLNNIYLNLCRYQIFISNLIRFVVVLTSLIMDWSTSVKLGRICKL